MKPTHLHGVLILLYSKTILKNNFGFYLFVCFNKIHSGFGRNSHKCTSWDQNSFLDFSGTMISTNRWYQKLSSEKLHCNFDMVYDNTSNMLSMKVNSQKAVFPQYETYSYCWSAPYMLRKLLSYDNEIFTVTYWFLKNTVKHICLLVGWSFLFFFFFGNILLPHWKQN